HSIGSTVMVLVSVICAACGRGGSPTTGQQRTPEKPVFRYQQVMIPMRDGVHLQTVILTPVEQQGPLPILFSRTPYGVPDEAPKQMPTYFKELAQDGYIFVSQNVRGRFKSEGVFIMNGAPNPNDPAATNEATDAYDSIEWLLKNVPNNNGRVGITGTS